MSAEGIAMTDDSVRDQWRALARLFPEWALPVDFFFNASSYRFWGADLIRSMQENWRVRRAAAMLAQQPQTLDGLVQIANVNLARTTDAFKAMALTYISLPLALAALASDAAPDVVRDALARYLHLIVPIVVAAALSPLHYFFCHWRAKQIVWTIELFRAGALSSPGDKL